MEMIFDKIVIASDHAGYEMKEVLKAALIKEGLAVVDCGTHSAESVDYPYYAHAAAYEFNFGGCEAGITLCGTGNGMNMSVNTYPEIRGALCWTPEIARLARAHNDAGFCSLPARFITSEMAWEIVRMFLSTPFEGGRHLRRIQEIEA